LHYRALVDLLVIGGSGLLGLRITRLARLAGHSRYELGLLIAARDGLDEAALPTGLRAATGSPGALDVRLDSTKTQARLNTRLRGAREFLAPTPA
jgi:dTDP-4-dehydrorhamnose reductase